MLMYGSEDAAPAYIFEMMMKMVKKIMMTRCNGSSNSTSEILASKRQVRLTFPNYSRFCWWNTTKQAYWGYGILIAHSSTAVSFTHTFRSFCDCSSVDNWNANEELSLVLYPIVLTLVRLGPCVFSRRMGLVSTSSKGQDENGNLEKKQLGKLKELVNHVEIVCFLRFLWELSDIQIITIQLNLLANICVTLIEMFFFFGS